MQQTMDKIEALVAQYENRLLKKGIVCTISKKYFEAKTPAFYFRHYDHIGVLVSHFIDKHENKNYKHQPNRKYCVVLCFYPNDKAQIKKNECKEYAFVLYEISRQQEGFAPEKITHKEKNILKKIRRTMNSVLKKTESKSATEVCKETQADQLRYLIQSEYGYKKTVFGIKRNVLLDIVSASFLIAFLIFAFIIYFAVA